MLGTGGHRNLFQLLSAAKGGSFITGCDSVLTVAMECFLLCVRVREKKKKVLRHKSKAADSPVTAAFPKVYPAYSLCTISVNELLPQEQQERNEGGLSGFFLP